MTQSPELLCIMPTYGRPSLAANALACFMAQDYPSHLRHMLIVDDAQQIASGDSEFNWSVLSLEKRAVSLPDKYNQAWQRCQDRYDAVCVWDDDDIYLPHHISSLVAALEANPQAVAVKPSKIYSLYQSRVPLVEDASGRFHGSLAVRMSHLRKIGGWPEMKRIDFDQQMLTSCRPCADSLPFCPSGKPSYIYRWQSTNAWHCSGDSKGPGDEGWYDRVPITEPGAVQSFGPKFDKETGELIRLLDN